MLWEFNVYVAVCLVNLGHESECDYYFNRSKGETHKVGLKGILIFLFTLRLTTSRSLHWMSARTSTGVGPIID